MKSGKHGDFNARYVNYARVQGRCPEAQLAFDRARFPGGLMAGFIMWNSARWSEWDAATGHEGPHSSADHVAYDRWLSQLTYGHGINVNDGSRGTNGYKGPDQCPNCKAGSKSKGRVILVMDSPSVVCPTCLGAGKVNAS